MTTRRLVLLAAGLASLAACGYPPEGAAPKPLAPDALQAAAARYPGVTPAQIDDGEKTFSARCNGCHHYPDRDAFSVAQWPVIMGRMAKNGRLTPQQHEDVLHFVLASRKAS